MSKARSPFIVLRLKANYIDLKIFRLKVSVLVLNNNKPTL